MLVLFPFSGGFLCLKSIAYSSKNIKFPVKNIKCPVGLILNLTMSGMIVIIGVVESVVDVCCGLPCPFCFVFIYIFYRNLNYEWLQCCC
jgi:hypothetical protein